MASATPAPVSGKGSSEKRVALVTGASTGIGAAICRELLKHDMIVVGCAREVHRIERIANEHYVHGGLGKLVAIQCDLANKDDITAMFNQIRGRWGKLHVCVNNAGFATDTPLTCGESDQWRNMLKVNILGLCICTRESIKLMEGIEDGLIIQVGCVMGHRVPEIPKGNVNTPNFGFYYGNKFMVRGLAESLRHELLRAKSTIRVALVSPGAVKTEMYERGYKKDAALHFYSNIECLQPEDVAQAIGYIMRVPSYVNVQDIIVQPADYSMTS